MTSIGLAARDKHGLKPTPRSAYLPKDLFDILMTGDRREIAWKHVEMIEIKVYIKCNQRYVRGSWQKFPFLVKKVQEYTIFDKY